MSRFNIILYGPPEHGITYTPSIRDDENDRTTLSMEPRIADTLAAWIRRCPSRATRSAWEVELCRGLTDSVRRERLAADPGVQVVICVGGVDVNVTCYGPGGRNHVPNVARWTWILNGCPAE